jgi:hypothetical protein
VAPATTWRRDRVVCLIVSLCEDCGLLCEDYVLLCEDYGFSLIYILLCQNFMYCCINLLYDLFWRLPIRGGRQHRDYIKNNIFLN